MISLPILRWTLGDQSLRYGIVFGVLIQVLLVLVILIQAWGFLNALFTISIIILLAWLAEWIGSSTGLLFGNYHYTQELHPQLLDVPLLVPFAWLMMLPPAWAVAAVLLGCPKKLGSWHSKIAFASLSALAFTAWDFFLDPQMVAWNFWQWDQPGGYFGIPWHNYLGWLIVSALITLIVGRVDLPIGPLLLVYLVTWILQTIGQGLFWGQPGPAVIGFLVMGTLLLITFFRLRRNSCKLSL